MDKGKLTILWQSFVDEIERLRKQRMNIFKKADQAHTERKIQKIRDTLKNG